MATTKQDRLDKLEQEVRNLRREFELFIPTESLEEYENANEIQSAYDNAVHEYGKRNQGDR